MIRINLLPEELQRAEAAARNVFICFLGGITVCALGAVIVLGFFFKSTSLKDTVADRRIQVELAKERSHEVDRINEDIAFYKERERAIIEIKSQRILWSKKLAQLAELAPRNIWITNMSMKMLDPTEYKWDGKTDQTGGRLSLTCYAEGTEVEALTNFRKALSGDKSFYKDLIDVRALPDNFFGDFSGFQAPAWSVVSLPGYVPPQNLQFNLEIDLKPLVPKPAADPSKDDKKNPKKKSGK